MNFNTFLWSISGAGSGYIIGVLTLPWFNRNFNKSYLFLRQLSYILVLTQIGFVGGYFRGYTGEPFINTIIKSINQ